MYFRFFSIIDYYKILSIVPLLYSRSLLAIYFINIACPVTKLCPSLCDPLDCSLPGSSAPGIFLVRILEWVAITFSRGYS